MALTFQEMSGIIGGMHAVESDSRPISVTCCRCSAENLDQSIKRVFGATEGDHWNFWRAMPNHLLNPEIEPRPGSHKLEYSVWTPKSGTLGSAFINNRQDGGDTIVSNISRLFRYEMMKIYISGAKAKYPYFNFQYFKDGAEIRRIYVMLDGDRWTFFQSGKQLPFEDSQRYQKRMIKSRLDARAVLMYSKAAGWDLKAQDFWSTSFPAYYGKQLEH